MDKHGSVFRELLSRRGNAHHLESSHELHKMSLSGREVVEVRVPVQARGSSASSLPISSMPLSPPVPEGA